MLLLNHWIFKKPANPERQIGFGAGVVIFLVASYISLNPLYIFPSGLPQPADLVAVLAMVLCLVGLIGKLPVFYNLYFFSFLFICWTMIVNTIFFALYPEKSSFVFSSLFIAYNIFLMILLIVCLEIFGERMARIIGFCLFLSLIIEITSVILGSEGGVRNYGSFNNPNQLGYWCILTVSCWIILLRDRKISLIDVFVLCSSFYMIILSASRASIYSFSLFVPLLFLFLRVDKIFIAASMLTVSLILVIYPNAFSLTYEAYDENLSGIQHRLEQKGYADSGEGRGYDWLVKYPEYLLLGAGDGGYGRFRDPKGAKEIHSTFASLLFSYGIVGLTIFAGLMWTIFRGAGLLELICVLPIVLYGLTHNGIRFSVLWVFFALTFYRLRHRRRAG